ncbi:CAP-associated domain-containing protein [Enterococcus canintestini]|uniref:CAP-associated domain-containing protein n=1 Tax=Enterococcus canintestini TaxID=317010 RepID=A0A267HV71_9ENTE|nr:CAP-associated domain-containing protein [Enterococcus canintestini]PAB02162.1 hypothetical protein AKL21_01185 [Enterococcus canintestini]
MKRRIIFLLLLVTAILVVYLQPVFFARQAPAYDSQTNKDISQTSLKYKPIKVSGYADLIGKSSSELRNLLGKPLVSYDSGFGYRVNTYQTDNENSYIAANIRNGKVAAVKIAGNDDKHTAPFKAGMTMNDLTKVTMLYPNFSLDYNGEKIQFELMEEDMNYRPLVAFTNDTFAILFFNQKKSQLMGITYLDKQMLLELAPYTSIEGQLPKVTKAQLTNWDEVNRLKEASAFELLNVLRKLEERDVYKTNFTLQGRADDINAEFLKEPKRFLNEERFKQLERMNDVSNPQPFLIVSDEFDQMLKKMKMPAMSGFYYRPMIDTMFQILSFYSDPYLHTRFLNEGQQKVGVGIDEDNMVILLEDTEETKDSE